MALVKCPECGKEISINAKNCPHCGTAIRICPDCETVYAGTPQSCTNCGFLFNKTNQTVNPEEITTGAIKEKWLAHASTDSTLIKNLKKLRTALNIIDIVMVTIIGLLFMTWAKSNPDDRVLSAGRTLNNITICVAVVCIFYIIEFVYDCVAERIIQLRFSNWLQTYNIDVKDYIKLHNKDFTDCNVQADFMLIANAEFFKENPNEKNYFYMTAVVNLIISTIAVILLGCCVTANIKIAMDFIFWEQEVDYSKLNYTLIVLAAIAMILKPIVKIILENKQAKKIENWLAENTKTKT